MGTLTKQAVIDKIEVLEDGRIQVRTANKVLEDKVTLSKSFFRYVLHPGQDLTDLDAKVVAVANAVWTSEVISAYEAKVEKGADGT